MLCILFFFFDLAYTSHYKICSLINAKVLWNKQVPLKKAGLQRFSSNKHTPQFFSNQTATVWSDSHRVKRQKRASEATG